MSLDVQPGDLITMTPDVDGGWLFFSSNPNFDDSSHVFIVRKSILGFVIATHIIEDADVEHVLWHCVITNKGIGWTLLGAGVVKCLTPQK